MAIHDKENISRYVDNELSPEEMQEMEAALQQDPALAAEVALCRELRAALRERLVADPGAGALREMLDQMNKRYFGAEQAQGGEPAVDKGAGRSGYVVPFRKWLGGIAAAAVVLFAVVRLWPSAGDGYLDRYGKTQMFSVTERGEGNDSLMQKASAYFNATDYAKALPLLDRAYREDSSNQSALFYRGVARLHLGRLDSARGDLNKVYEGSSLFRYEAAFYMALSFAEEKNRTAAGEWLKKIPEGAPASDKAKELRKGLE